MLESNRPGRRVALVLAGGAARGAYEVGVVHYLLEEVSRTLGRDVPLDIFCGTSVGALNACALAAFAETPRGRAARLAAIWRTLRIEQMIRIDSPGLLKMGKRLFSRTPSPRGNPVREGGLLDPRGLEHLLEHAIPFRAIRNNLDQGYLDAITVSTTHMVTGRTVVFVQQRGLGLPPWSMDPTIEPRAAQLSAQHALASAAIPILFPSVLLDNEFHCDGGLRQNVPLSPARRLGAGGVIVINPRYIGAPVFSEATTAAEDQFPGPLFALGKTLNALLLDRLDTDLARLDTINRILEAGARAYGPDFVDRLNEAMGYYAPRGLRPMRSVLIRSSENIGDLAAAYVRRAAFGKRVGGVLGRVISSLADTDAQSESDLLSYVLFDGEFASSLIDLGYRDARSRHDELCAFFDAVHEPS
jgi:NTE family protein